MIDTQGDLRGACSVITGGASGIGKALARELVRRGGRVALADISLDEATATADEIGSGARAYQCDVTSRKKVLQISDKIERDLGPVNLVFANAGVFVEAKLQEMAPDEFDWLFDVNVKGVFNIIQAFTTHLLKHASRGDLARFVLTGSESSVGLPSQGVMTAYTATKHAVLGIADGLRRDLDETGVGVSILCPGPVITRIWDARRSRQARHGGPAAAEPKTADAAQRIFASIGQDPDVTARLCLDGVSRDEFMIVTDPKIRSYAARRHAEVDAALDLLDRPIA